MTIITDASRHEHVADTIVTDGRGDLVLSLGRADWADWDRAGDLLFANSGKIFRLRAKSSKPYLLSIQSAVELIDLNGSRFEAIPPTAWETSW